MGRRSSGIKHPALPDAKYNSVIVTKLINRLMIDGKQNTAESVVYGAMEIMAAQEGKDAVSLVETAVKNVTPMLEVKARRVGGANYQVPVEVRPDRAFSSALRWLAKSRPQPLRQVNGREAFGRTVRRRQGPGFGSQEARRDAQDGRRQPRLRPLSLVNTQETIGNPKLIL